MHGKTAEEVAISIHAPRTGSDDEVPRGCRKPVHFNPRSPHGERHKSAVFIRVRTQFQSTLPARGATMSKNKQAVRTRFQSTLPARGATTPKAHPFRRKQISIHAPRTGSDSSQKRLISPLWDFNPRSPHGERQKQENNTQNGRGFQSTLPARGATKSSRARARQKEDFNPRSPHGERRARNGRKRRNRYFNPRSPHGERRHSGSRHAAGAGDFNPRSPHGERQRKVTILSIRIIGFAQKVYHKTVLLRISLAENAVILPKRPRNPVRTSLQKAGGLRFARAIRAARPYSISSPSGA